MKRLSIKKIFVIILEYALKYGLGIGIIALPILFSIFEDIFPLILILFIFAMFVCGVYYALKDIREEFEKKDREVDLEKQEIQESYKIERKKLIDSYNNSKKQVETEKQTINKILEDEKIYKPYLAKLLEDYYYEVDTLREKHLRLKKRPAIKAANEVADIKRENRELIKKAQIYKNQLMVYETLFPWLEEFKEIPEQEINKIISADNSEGYDRVKDFLSPEEYNKLEDYQKYQLWLDRYRAKSNKSNWEIGIDFERFVGYKYETEGYKIIYNGAREGIEDMGRDLIATKGNDLLVIQCKNWSKNKTIHEKHIFQLYGTMILKAIDEPNKNIKGLFICTTNLSDTAREVAKHLNIEVMENYIYDRNYPCIKCNISKKDGSKIYHLPFDQQYDRIDVEVNIGERYAATVEEAERLGFRKAMRHTIY